MLIKIARYVLMTSLCVSSTNWAKKNSDPYKNIDPYKLLGQMYKDIDNNQLSRKKEEIYAKQLRLLFLQRMKDTAETRASVLFALECELQHHILHQFPSITYQEYKEAGSSVGIALMRKGHNEQAVDALVREAKTYLSAALVILQKLYQSPLQGCIQYDPRIFELFKELALEGHPCCQFNYGMILLYGWGVQKNVGDGLKYIELALQSGVTASRACLELVFYYFEQQDMDNFEKYAQLIVKQQNPEALSRVAFLEMKRGNYHKEFILCTKALELDPECNNAKFLLGAMYIEGLGVTIDKVKGFILIQQVAEKTDEHKDAELKALAYFNLGNLYEKGIGTEQSFTKAEECFKKAEELGCEPE